jgi:hypothetical protein
MNNRWVGVFSAAAIALAAQTAVAQSVPGANPLQGAINQLQINIDTEAGARAGMDATLLSRIQSETEAREAAISALQAGTSTGSTRCYGIHFVRGAPPLADEIQFTAIFFNNGDLEHAAVVERLTIRDDQGTILHDSGPKTARPHPLATAPIPALDITTVPPGATYGFSSTDIWGFNTIPAQLGRGTRSLSVTVEVSKPGDPKLLMVHARQIVRQRLFAPTAPFAFTGLGAERSNTDSACFPVPRS